MSNKVSHLVWDTSRHKGAALLVMLALADIANDDGVAWPGAGDEGWLAKRARVSGRAVREAVNEKLAVGDAPELRVQRRPGRTNLYRINLELLEDRRAEQRAEDSSGVRSPIGEQGSKTGSAEQSAGVEEQRSARGLLYDALIEHVYGLDDDKSLTGKERRKVGMTSVELHGAGATADEVAARVRRYKEHPTYGRVALTVMSLANHWAELAGPQKRPGTEPCPECGVGGGLHVEGCARATGGR